MNNINDFWKMYSYGNWRAHPVFDGVVFTPNTLLANDADALILTDDSGSIELTPDNVTVIGNLIRFV